MQRAGLLSENQVQTARIHGSERNISFVDSLLELGLSDEDAIVAFAQSKLMIPSVRDAILGRITPETLRVLNPQLAAAHSVVPVSLDSQNNLTLAMADPTDIEAVSAVAEHTRRCVVRAIAPASALASALTRYYGAVAAPSQARTLNGEVEDVPAVAGPRSHPTGTLPRAADPHPTGSHPQMGGPHPTGSHARIGNDPTMMPPRKHPSGEQPVYSQQSRMPQRSAPPTGEPPRGAKRPDRITQIGMPNKATVEEPPPPVKPAQAGVPEPTVGRGSWEPPFSDHQDEPVPLSPEALDRTRPRFATILDRDDVTRLLLDYLGAGFTRVILFLNTRGELKGHDCRGSDLLVDAVRRVRIPTTGDSMFSRVLQNASVHFGPARLSGPIDESFARAMGGLKGNILLLPIKVGSAVPLVVFAQGASAPVDPRSILELSELVGHAIARIIATRRS